MPRSSRSRSGSLSTRQSMVGRGSSSGMTRGGVSTPPQGYSNNNVPSTKSGGGGILSNLMGTVASGMASGVGFGVAQRAVDAVIGPRQVEVTHTNQASLNSAPTDMNRNQMGAIESGRNQMNKCQPFLEELNHCLMRHSDVSLCQNYADSLKSCQQSM